MDTLEKLVTKPWLVHYPVGVPHHLELSQSKTLVEMLNETVSAFPDNIALHFMGKDIPYKHLGKFTRRLAVRLSQMGVKQGDRVALLMGNCPHAVISYLAVTMLGAMVVPCNPLYTERELAKQIAGVAVVITLDLFYLKAKSVAALHEIKNIIVASFPEFLPIAKSLLFGTPIGYPRVIKSKIKKAEAREKDCLAHQDETCVLEAQKEEKKLQADLVRFNESRAAIRKDAKSIHFFGAMVFEKVPQKNWDALDNSFPKPSDGGDLIFTSGTTGVSKAAKRTHGNLWASTEQVKCWFFNAKPGKEIFLWVLPIFHTFGITTMNLCLSLGGKLLVVPDATDIPVVMELIEKQKPTAMLGVPKLFLALVKRHPQGKDWSSIKNSVAGGAKMETSIIEPFEKITDGKLVEGYGASEAPVICCNPLSGLVKSGSIGIPLPETDAKIMVKNTNEEYYEAKIGAEGELWASGPQVMECYLNSPEETANVFVIDDSDTLWLKTGDLAHMDEDGYFFITGLLKNLIIGDNGLKINPVEVAEVLCLHPSIQNAVVVGMPMGKDGKEIAEAFVILETGHSVTPEELIAHCKANLAPYKIPKKILFRNEFPLTMKGGIMGYKLREEELAKRGKK
jgi:long-chain acyl-CoA synthetase